MKPIIPNDPNSYFDHRMVNSERDINGSVKTVRGLPSLPDPISYSNLISNPAPKITERREDE